ncbi:hypothetical protein [Yersinia pseudotuberculosis]|uniref:hypothetical protein n=1 Tax=Yersinia pseudotuberculosis TaxID=633 RepID=UPI000F6E70D4|nr:hypothetical protein [Yersinia pseudotuberculosis]VEE72851.1 Uncharacterised protein [Yersinia pseudotuberculosis]
MVNLLRWISILPLAFISAMVIPAFLKLLTNFGFFNFRVDEPPPFYVELGLSFFVGAAFVFVGKMIAPSKKDLVAKILFCIATIVLIFLFVFNWSLGEKMAAFYCLPSLIGAFIAMHYEID